MKMRKGASQEREKVAYAGQIVDSGYRRLLELSRHDPVLSERLEELRARARRSYAFLEELMEVREDGQKGLSGGDDPSGRADEQRDAGAYQCI